MGVFVITVGWKGVLVPVGVWVGVPLVVGCSVPVLVGVGVRVNTMGRVG